MELWLFIEHDPTVIRQAATLGVQGSARLSRFTPATGGGRPRHGTGSKWGKPFASKQRCYGILLIGVAEFLLGYLR